MSREELRFSVCNSSVRTFAMQMTRIDALLALALGVAAGCSAYAWCGEATVARRAAHALLASIGACSAFVIVRALVPFVLHLSFANMMRLRLPFYLWIVSLLVVAGLCGAADLFSTVSFSSVQFSLILASVALTVRFFQSGSLLRLVLAFSCAGGAVGLSLLGVLAPAVMFALMRSMAVRMLVACDSTCWDDRPNPGVVEYFANPLVRSRMKWMFIGGFLVCCGLAFRLILRGAGGLSGAGHAWLGCIGADGAVFLLVTAILPLAVGLGKAGPTSEVTESSDSGGLIVYMAIVPFTALFMLKPGLLPSLAKIDMHVEAGVLALASVVHVFNLLLAGLVILADIRCRDFRGVDDVCADRLRNVMRFSYAVVSIAPLALAGCAAFLHLK